MEALRPGGLRVGWGYPRRNPQSLARAIRRRTDPLRRRLGTGREYRLLFPRPCRCARQPDESRGFSIVDAETKKTGPAGLSAATPVEAPRRIPSSRPNASPLPSLENGHLSEGKFARCRCNSRCGGLSNYNALSCAAAHLKQKCNKRGNYQPECTLRTSWPCRIPECCV